MPSKNIRKDRQFAIAEFAVLVCDRDEAFEQIQAGDDTMSSTFEWLSEQVVEWAARCADLGVEHEAQLRAGRLAAKRAKA